MMILCIRIPAVMSFQWITEAIIAMRRLTLGAAEERGDILQTSRISPHAD
jgi:hypothetical protein